MKAEIPRITNIPLFLLYDKEEVRCDRKRADETIRPEKYILVEVQEASQPLSEKDHLTNTSPGSKLDKGRALYGGGAYCVTWF